METLLQIQTFLLAELGSDKILIDSEEMSSDMIDPLMAISPRIKVSEQPQTLGLGFKVKAVIQYPPLQQDLRLNPAISKKLSEIVPTWKFRTVDGQKLWEHFHSLFPLASDKYHLCVPPKIEPDWDALESDEMNETFQDIFDWLLSSYIGRQRSLKDFQVAHQDSKGKFVNVAD